MKYIVFVGMFFGSVACASNDQLRNYLQQLGIGYCPVRSDWNARMPVNHAATIAQLDLVARGHIEMPSQDTLNKPLHERIKEDKASLRVKELLAPDAHAATIAQSDLVVAAPSSPVTIDAEAKKREKMAADARDRQNALIAWQKREEMEEHMAAQYAKRVQMREGSNLRSGSRSRCDGSPNSSQGLRRLGTLQTAPSSPSTSTSTSRAVSPVPAVPTDDAVRYAPKPRRDEQSKSVL